MWRRDYDYGDITTLEIPELESFVVRFNLNDDYGNRRDELEYLD